MLGLARLRDHQGQALILGVLFMSVTFVIGVLIVDVGIWITERRGAQSDADFASLKGAWELLDPNATAADAEAAALDNLAANDEQANASLAQPIVVDDSCFNQGRLDAVTVDVNHQAGLLFASIFDLVAPVPGAHAKACAGAVLTTNPADLVPFEVDNDTAPCFKADETPNFTELCGLEYGAQGAFVGNRQLLDLDVEPECSAVHGGVQNVDDLIANGAPGTCMINTSGSCDPTRNGPWYDCVSVQPGNAKKVKDGVERRIAKEGQCDTNSDGIEDFEETVELVFDTGDPFTSIYAPRDCDPFTDGVQKSWRLVMIIVLDKKPTGNSAFGQPIEAFAGFYLAGCLTEAIPDPGVDDLDRKCSRRSGPPGRVVVYGQFVNLITSGGGVTAPNPSSTLFGIGLVE
jgi:hypothetical protein